LRGDDTATGSVPRDDRFRPERRHTDRFDDAARGAVAEDAPLFRRPAGADAFAEEGVTDVRPAADATAVVVHVVATDGCPFSRGELRAAVDGVPVPEDGEYVPP